MADTLDFLATIPLFSVLERDELRAVLPHLIESTHARGDFVCRSGEEGDQFYIVLSGELEVWVGESNRRGRQVLHRPDRRSLSRNRQRRIGILKRGDCFGEMALLQGGKRTATVIVRRHAELISLNRASFEKLFLDDPRILRYFTRLLSSRLASLNRGGTVLSGTMTISVTGRAGLKGKSIVASGLAAVLHSLTGTEILLVKFQPRQNTDEGVADYVLAEEFDSAADSVSAAIKSQWPGLSVLDVPVRMDRDVSFYVQLASVLISKVSKRFRIVVFDLGSEPFALKESASGFSDALVEIMEEPEELPVLESDLQTIRFQVINLYNSGSKPIPINQCEPFVIPFDSSLSIGDATAYVRSSPRGPAALPIHRLARKMLGATVGVALGGGAAFGIAHLGVLKVLEQNDIPIDILAGCSQGSIIGAGFAAGVSVDEMIELAHRLGRKRNFLLPFDPTLSQPGILAGNRFIDMFSPLLRGKDKFEDLLIPYRTVATDIENSERIEIGSGKLTDAFRASSSLPMVFSPFQMGARVLVDGGLSDPVGAEVVRNMGADLCIAVNVVPPLKKGLENEVSRAFRLFNRLNPLSYLGSNRNLPNMFDIIMNSMQTLQYELGNFKSVSADVLINPDLTDFTWIEYYRSEELIQRGMEAAERAIPAIERAYGEKLAPFRNPSGD